MANPRRTPGKHGCKPRDPSRHVLTVEHYLRPWEGPVALAAPPAAQPQSPAAPPGSAQSPLLPPLLAGTDVDYESAVSDWPMYVNGPDPSNPPYAPGGVGDCTIAGPAHAFTAQRVYAGYYEPHFDNEVIVDAYSACGGYVKGDPSTDNGCDPLEVLSYLRSTGLPDTAGYVHKLAGYAVFREPRNQPLITQVLSAYGTVGIAFDCDQQFEDDFAADAPVSYQPGSPSLGGHFVVLQHRRHGGRGVLEEVTWGAVARVTLAYHWHQVRDVYLMFSEDFVAGSGHTIQGLDTAQLLADMAAVS